MSEQEEPKTIVQKPLEERAPKKRRPGWVKNVHLDDQVSGNGVGEDYWQPPEKTNERSR